MNPMRLVADGLSNILSGLGGRNDKAAFSAYQFSVVTQQDVEASYRTSWLMRKIVDLPAYDMCREWRDWQAKGPQIEAIEGIERAHGIAGKVQRALLLARLYGGAALIVGVNGENPAEPLDIERVRSGSLRYIHVLSRYQLSVAEPIADPEDPLFGQPEYFEITGARSGNVVRVHPSRVTAFHGQRLPEGSLLQGAANGDLFWGDPLMQIIQDAVKNADLTQAGIAQLVHEAKVDVINIPGLMSQIGTAEYEGRLMRRLNIATTMKSATNALVLDGEETWSSKSANFSQLPDVARLYLQIAAGAADIPATRLLGQAPAGMNATGESDLRNYYDMLSSRQNTDLRPTTAPLDEIIIRSATGARDADIHYTFGSLWQLSATEKATVDKAIADTAAVWVNTGLVPNEALAKGAQNRLVEDGTYPGLDAALADAAASSALPPILEEPEPVDPSAIVAVPGQSNVVPLKRAANDAAPRSLYVSRKLVNSAEFIAWAKGQGFATTTPADDLHVTVAFSRTPIDWMKVGEGWEGDSKGQITVAPGGARLVEKLGDKGAAVLLFNSSSLAWRHMAIREAGASWDFPEYQPHVTITYQAGDVDLAKVEPYRGALVFGPEIFAEVTDDWETTVTEE